MSADVIFIEDASGLKEMPASGFALEDDLQSLVERHPALLCGAQMNRDNPRVFLLVGREFGVPDRDGGGGRWSLDHLFVDQDAIPTLVEVKRASDTRARREVVAQMLDYAANGVHAQRLDPARPRHRARLGMDPTRVLLDFVGAEQVDGFWDRAVENLRHGRIRLIFLIDRVPHELRRIVEWLNEQTTETEVLAVEVMQYGTVDHRVLVPRLIGATTTAAAVKRSATRGLGFEARLADASPESKELGERLKAWGLRNAIHTRRTHEGLKYLAEDGQDLCTFYPHWDGLEMLVSIRRSSHPVESEKLLRALESFVGSSLSGNAPIVYCNKLLTNWDAFENEILTPFARAFRSVD